MDVQMPDGTTITDVPDGITQKELLRRYQISSGPPPSTAEDVTKAIAYAPGKAVTGFAGLPGDLRDLAGAAKDKALSYLPDWARNADKITSAASPTTYLPKLFPTSGQLRGAAESVTGPWYDPQTRAGKIADTATQAATTFGRSLVTSPLKALPVVAGITAGAEGAGAATGDNPWTKAAGGVVGGGFPAFLQAMRSRPGVVLSDALGKKTPADIDAAIARQDMAQQQGVPLLGTESFDAGHQLTSAVGAHPSGNAIIDQFMRQRPAQVTSAVQRDIIGPTGLLDTPANNASRAQQAATQYISDAEKARTQAVSPLYQAAQNDTVNVLPAYAQIQALQQNYPKGLFPSEHDAIGQYIKKLADPQASNAAFMDKLYQSARNDSMPSSINATPQEKNIAAAIGPIAQELRTASGQSPNIAQGRARYQRITDQVIDPLNASPIGTIAGKSGFDAAEASPIPRIVNQIADPALARPQTIRDTYQKLNGTDPRAFPGIVQTHLENQLNAATADIRSGPNPTAGAKFRQAIVGTPQEQANFNEMMRGVAHASGANPDAVVSGANNLLKTLELTGRTPGIGSATATRGDISKELGKTLLGDTLSTISITPTKPLARRFEDWIQRGRYEDMAKALTAPNSVQLLAKMAKLDPKGVTAQFYAASLLGLDRAIASGQ